LKIRFFFIIEEEITCAKMAEIALHAKSKLGPTLINKDLHPQSPNGTILAGIIRRHALVVGNGEQTKCVGKITRKRRNKNDWKKALWTLS
jgi:hypothetical protein